MKVTLIQHPVNTEYVAGIAASLCVDKFTHMEDNFTRNMKAAVASGHLSVLEHIPFTFLIEDISRAASHQLVRHRMASYSQQSQRYAVVDVGANWYIIPESIRNIPVALGAYESFMEEVSKFYEDLTNMGVPREDARMVLPNATHTSILMSMNARAFIEMCSKRICRKAQWEIQEMFTRMREAIREGYPTVYSLAVPPCASTGRCPESRPCGTPFIVRNVRR